MNRDYHTPVLLEEAVHALLTDRNGVYVDGTLGGGGHAEEICRNLASDGKLICFDADGDAIGFASRRLEPFSTQVIYVHENFNRLATELAHRQTGSINGLLLDLGVSSFQIDEEAKGFSFRGDERVDMRMDRRQTLSGWNVVNEYDESALTGIFRKYGEERNARRIARQIMTDRPIETTMQLAETIESASGKKFLPKTLARIFQAIRIEVNDELKSLQQTLNDVVEMMAPGGRIVVLSYHSLEDRIVKNFFKDASLDKMPSGHKYIPDTMIIPKLRVITKSPVLAGDEEIERNPRARSAKMRVAERINTIDS